MAAPGRRGVVPLTLAKARDLWAFLSRSERRQAAEERVRTIEAQAELIRGSLADEHECSEPSSSHR